MKKLFLLAVGLAMTLTACQKDEGLVSDVATTSSFTVTIPQSGVQTRAVTDAFGTGTSVNPVFWKSTTATSCTIASKRA